MKTLATNSIAMLLCSIALIAGGCRRPAYQDVYVQNMAAEIRELEDIIYEYDHEYRKLEIELEAVQRENELLKKLGISSKASSAAGSGSLSPSPSDRNWQDRSQNAEKTPQPPANLVPPANLESSSKTVPPSMLESGAEPPQNVQAESAPSTPLKSLKTEDAAPLKLEPSPTPAIKEDNLPAPPPSILPPPNRDSGKSTGNVAEPGLMEPPAIDLGEPMDSLPLDPNKDLPNDASKVKEGTTPPAQLLPPPKLGALEVELGRIPKTSGARRQPDRSSPATDALNKSMSGNMISQATFAETKPAPTNAKQNEFTAPLDQRMTEIAFVRPFSITLDLDGQPGDDAVRLVLQPRNAAGEFLNQAADLTVSMIDPEIQDETGRLGIWKYSAAEVAPLIRKQGQAKGIHVDISLEGKVPVSKKVVVFVRYVTADGRRLENQYEYTFSTPGDLESKWLPRADQSSGNPRDRRG